jgi:transposase InsO family protein
MKHPHWGPKKLWVLLRERYPNSSLPAISTLGAILRRQGLVRPRRRRWRRQVTSASDLNAPQQPNEIWAVDFKGWFRTRDGRPCYPLTVSDLFSRYVLTIRALSQARYAETRTTFEKLFSLYGLPQRIRSDNGAPFASIGAGGLSRLSAWWVRLGIALELITPGHPEQNGSHERMHRTLKQEAVRSPAANCRAQQRRFNRWRDEFNLTRPHEALAMQRPAQLYRASTRVYPTVVAHPVYPADYAIRRVRHCAAIKWQGRQRHIGEALVGQLVGLREVEPGCHEVYFGSVLLGCLYDQDPGGIRPAVRRGVRTVVNTIEPGCPAAAGQPGSNSQPLGKCHPCP